MRWCGWRGFGDRPYVLEKSGGVVGATRRVGHGALDLPALPLEGLPLSRSPLIFFPR